MKEFVVGVISEAKQVCSVFPGTSGHVILSVRTVLNDVGYSLKEESAGVLTSVKCSQRAQKVHEGALKHVPV